MNKSIKKLALLIALLFVCSTFLVQPVSAQALTTNKYPIYAGQNWEIGYLEVTNDAENYYVTYNMFPEIATEGWVFTELHLSVESSEPAIPQTKTGNPIPGQFEFSAYPSSSAPYTFTVPITEGGSIVIAAHAAIEREEVIVNEVAPYGSYTWIAAEQGTKYDYTPVKLARSNPDNALALEVAETENESFFYSLGFQDYVDGQPTTAYIILEFANPIVNGDGADLEVVEDTWGLPYPNEKADIYVSNSPDGPWTYLGTADNQTIYDSYHTTSKFDLPADMASAKYVKVQDASIRADFASKYPSQAATLDGFDLNAVLALHSNTTTKTYSESAWAAEAVGVNRFVKKGNWATYITYTTQQCKKLVDTFTVDSNINREGNPVSSIVLKDGGNYEIVVSGTYTYKGAAGGIYWADAEWYWHETQGLVKDVGSKAYVLDMCINNASANIDWGDYNDAHVYKYNFVGTGAAANFFIYDSNNNDNIGALTVNIYEVY